MSLLIIKIRKPKYATESLLVKPRAYRLQRRRGHVSAIVLCVPSKIQVRQWFVTNYSNNGCLDCTMHIEELYYF